MKHASSNVQLLDARTLHITSSANDFGNRSDVLKSLLTSAATEAKNRGFKYFAIINSNSYEDSRIEHQPARYYDNGIVLPSTTKEIRNPVQEATVKLYREGEINPNQEGVWDADSVLSVSQDK